MGVAVSLLFVALIAAVLVVQQIEHQRLSARVAALEPAEDDPPDKPPDAGLGIVHDRHSGDDGTITRSYEHRPGHVTTFRIRAEEAIPEEGTS